MQGQTSITVRRLATTLVLLIAVAAGAGSCGLHAHAGAHHDVSHAPDLCIGAPGVALATAPEVGLAVVGRAPVAPRPEVGSSTLDVLELPPKR